MNVGEAFTSDSIAVPASAVRPRASRQSALYLLCLECVERAGDFECFVVFGGGVERLEVDFGGLCRG